MLIADNIHLFYCLNVYPAGTKPEFDEAVFHRAARVLAKAGLAEKNAVGVWLRDSLLHDFDSFSFSSKLKDSALYCPSFNGFPFSIFHASRIKERVYQPDWSTPQRLEYTKNLGLTLSRIIEKGVPGSISTLPVCFRDYADEEITARAVDNLRDCARFFRNIYRETGRKISLAIEPEPDCFLDTSEAAAAWFEEVLFNHGDEELLREFIGVCLDTVHSSVLFEKPVDTLENFHRRGINVHKIQLGSAIAFDSPTGLAEIGKYSDEVYLHQTRVKNAEKFYSYTDLPQALSEKPQGEWRVHYHTPLTWQGSGGLRSTSSEVDREFIARAIKYGVQHFEVEIYTLDVFPDAELDSDEVFINDLRHAHQLIRSCL